MFGALSCRDFLKGSAALAAVLSLSSWFPAAGRVRGQNSPLPAAASINPFPSSQLATGQPIADVQTYAMLPQHVPVDRLHCQSCHLDGGGNPTAAWWVGMRAVYTSTASLQARINGCFERSMNGSPLCTPASAATPGDCDADPDMMAFVAYMDWLDEQWQGQGLKTAPPLGFPPIARMVADPAHGAAIYEDRCGICHDPDGAGQYVGQVFAFPALWRPHSFNTSAGLAAHPQSLAAFVRWSMPYDEPGALSDQEARDLAAHIDAQP